MLIKRLTVLFLFLLFSVCPIAAQSPPTQQNNIKPIPKQERTTTSSPAKSGEHEENPTNHQSNTNKAMVAVEEIKPVIEKDTSKPRYDYEAANLKVQRQLSKSTKTIAYFTILLVIVTAILAGVAIWQGYHLKQSVDSLCHAERAYLFVKVQLSEGISRIGYRDIEIIISNYGKTPAIIMNRDNCLQTFETKIPDINFPSCEVEDPPGTVIIGSGKDWTQYPGISNDIFQKINGISDRLICMGRVRYEDVFGNPHETGFFYEYDVRFKMFFPVKGNKRNYHT